MSAIENIIHVDDDSYQQTIEEDRLVLLDFWADWCGPCTALEPVIEELAQEYPSLTVGKVDTEENKAAMDEFGIKSIPTIILFEHGEPVEVFAGKVPYPKLERSVSDHA